MKLNKKQGGFTLMELMFVLGIGGALTLGSAAWFYQKSEQYKREDTAKQLVSYSKAINTFVNNNQAVIYNNKESLPMTISPEQLAKYGVIPTNAFTKLSDPSGGNLIPCAVIYHEKNKLQGFVYYRTDKSSLSLSGISAENLPKRTTELLNSLGTIGANGSVLTGANGSYSLKTKANSWSLSSAQVTQYLTQSGGDILGDGLNKCSGTYIAAPSYMLTLNSKLNDVNSELNQSDVVKQNSNEIISQDNVNNKIDNLNLDSKNVNNDSFKAVNNNKLIFQSNSGCVMDPSKLSTMQDYADCPGSDCPDIQSTQGYSGLGTNSCPTLGSTFPNINQTAKCDSLTIPNKFGCRNQQLSVGVQDAYISDPNGVTKSPIQAVAIGGFEKVTTSTTTKMSTGYLGGLTADSIQATAQLGYGDSCLADEVGSMALQKRYAGNTALEKLYNLNQSLLVCQKSLLCENSVLGVDGNPSDVKQCWLPLSTTDATVTFSQNEKILGIKAPSGYYIKDVEYYNADNSVWIGDYPNNRFTPYDLERRGSGSSVGRNCYAEDRQDWMGVTWSSCDTSGNINMPPSYILTSIPDGNIYFPYNSVKENLGITILARNQLPVLQETGAKNFDVSNYFDNCSGDRSQCLKISNNPNTATNFSKNATKQFNYKYGSTYPYSVNPKYQLRQTSWNHNSFNGKNCGQCDNWKFGKILSIPYYINKVTFSNNTDNMSIDSTTTPDAPIPPAPPAGTCNSSNLPAYMNQEITDRMNQQNVDANGKDITLAQPNNLNINITNDSSYACKVKASANYCPYENVCQSYRITFTPEPRCNKNQCWPASPISQTCDVGGAGIAYFAGASTAPRYHPCSCLSTDTSCQCVSSQLTPTTTCSNPSTIDIYENGYTF